MKIEKVGSADILSAAVQAQAMNGNCAEEDKVKKMCVCPFCALSLNGSGQDVRAPCRNFFIK